MAITEVKVWVDDGTHDIVGLGHSFRDCAIAGGWRWTMSAIDDDGYRLTLRSNSGEDYEVLIRRIEG